MNRNRTSIRLDVHARSVVAAAIDSETGEVHRRRLTPVETSPETIDWLCNEYRSQMAHLSSALSRPMPVITAFGTAQTLGQVTVSTKAGAVPNPLGDIERLDVQNCR